MAALDSTPIANWQNAKLRLEKERKENAQCLTQPQTCSQSIRDWQQKIATWSDLSDFEQITAVNRFANRVIRYTEDSKNFQKSDYWATPAQSLRGGRGDCEDYVLLKYETLLSLGFAKQDLRIVVVTDQRKNIGHAVLSVKTAKGTFILDNQNQRVLRHDSIRHYAPLYSINEKGRWMNVATRDVRKRNAAPVVLVADNVEQNNVMPAAASVAQAVPKPVYKKPIDVKPVQAQTITPRLQAVASIAMLRYPVSIAERESDIIVKPPTVLQRWAILISPLFKFFAQTDA